MKDAEIIEVLTKDIEEKILDRMPEWFRLLRTYYSKRKTPGNFKKLRALKGASIEEF